MVSKPSPKPTFAYHLILSLLLVCSSYAGVITPMTANPIIASTANRNELSDYTFSFAPETDMPAGTQVNVTFPGQYRSGLGIPIEPTCSVPCSLSDRTVQFTISSAVSSGTTVTVTINDIENPEAKGGTGSFKVLTLRGVNVLDENAIFGTIGIANSVSTLGFTNVVLVTGGKSSTGETTSYAFSFKVTQAIPAGSYFKFTISDTRFILDANPVCSVFAINGKTITGTFTCTTVDRDVFVRGLTANIPALQDVGVQVQMTNPSVAGQTDSFEISVLRGSTNIIYDRRTSIPGVVITPSSLSNVTLVPVDTGAVQAKNNIMDYVLTYMIKNPLALGSSITMQFPLEFQIDSDTPSAHYVKFGLEDPSESSPVVMDIDYDNNIITLSNFKALNASTLISLQVRLQNPAESGVTSAMAIYTYGDADQTQVIDADTTSAYTTIASVESPTSYSITTQSLTVSAVLTSVEFLFKPSSSVPGSGVIKVRIPSSFTVGAISGTSCQVKSAASGSYVAATCTNAAGVLSITLPSGTSFASGTDSYFSLNSLLTSPATNGTYLFDVTSYQAGGTTVIESWTVPLTLVAPGFTSNTVTTLCVGAGKTTLLDFKFQPTLLIPAGKTQTTTNDTKGVLEFEFSGAANDLGTGNSDVSVVPCKPISGLTAISGRVNCYLYPGTNPVIRVDNFQQIAAGTAVEIVFSKISNPSPAPISNAFSVKVKAYKILNRVRTDLNTGTVSVSVLTAATLTESATTASSSYTFSNNVVLGSTSVTFTPATTTTLTGPGTILVELPYYDSGYIPVPNSLTCQLGSVAATCLGYAIADWVAITLPSASTFTAGTSVTITGLKVPQYSTTQSAGPLFRYIQGSTQQETINRPQQVFPAPATPTFTSATLTTTNTQAAAVNVDYTFTFVPPNKVPSGSSLIITFPTGYNLLDSNPPVSFSSTSLVPVSTTDGISFTRSYSQVIITGFTDIAAGASINVKISGVKNPSGLTQSIGWTAEIDYQGGIAVYHSSFSQFDFTSSGSVRVLSIGSINVFPLNALQEAQYNITFTPQTPIPVYGEIRITFPSLNYKVLPSPPSCRVSGAITTFSSCTLSGSKIIVKLDTAYTSGDICVTVSGVKNPSQGTTLAFTVETYYDGVKIDETDSTTTANRKVTLVSAANAITMNSLGFAPKNEGEPATYTFSFLPTTALTSDMMIQVLFPSVYDNNLGSGVTCSVSSGLSGNFLCGIDRRVVSITGFTAYTPDSTKPITISIYNVVNPNRLLNDDSKQFKIATLKQGGTSYVDINTQAGTVETLDAPGWAMLWGITPTNSNARTSADYTFNFSTFDKIPKQSSGGEVRISLPEEFEMNDEDLTCEPQTSDFASTLTCSIERNNIIIYGNTLDYSGNVVLTVKGITNPVSAGTITNIQVKVYDDFNEKVVERTYSNLDIFANTYAYPGPLIYVNGDNALTIERGTQTPDLYITMDYPSALSLSITPTTPGFSIIPFYIDFPLGNNKAKFRMSVPADFALGTYYVQWTTLGELIPPYYTPLRRTKVTIVSQQNLQIDCPDILPIPMNGNSLPNTFTLTNGPNSDLAISLSFLASYPGITLSTSTVSFKAGAMQASFTVYASSTTAVTSGSILLTVTGTNADTYQLETSMLNFTVVSAVTASPTIDSVTQSSILANTATFSVTVSQKCMLYYVVALKGTDTPTLNEAVNFGPAPYTSTLSRYFSFKVSEETYINSITISSLVAETPYVLFVYAVNQGGSSAGPTQVDFNTANRYEVAEFQLQFTQGTLNSAEKQVAINAVAFLLSLDPSKIQEKKYSYRRLAAVNNDGGNERRFLGSSSDSTDRMLATSLVTLQMMPIPESSLYSSPKTLALSLNSKMTQLSAQLSNLDSSYTITATELGVESFAYSGTPSFTATGTSFATFTGQLTNYGNLFVVCVKQSEDKGTPTPYQVWNGLSSNNVKNPSASIEVSSPNTAFVMNVTDLDEGTDYNAYIIGGSAHPGYPDLMLQASVTKAQFKTDVTPIVTTVKKKSGEIVGTAWSVLVGMLCLLFLM